MESVAHVLDEIGAGSVPVITVFNKIDMTDHEPSLVRDELTGAVKSVFLSAQSGQGLDLLRRALSEYAAAKKEDFSKVAVPAVATDFL